MKTVYLYDEKTFQFAGIYEANPSPMEPDKFIEPIHSTDVEPITVNENQIAVFDAHAKKWFAKDIESEPIPIPEEIELTYQQKRAMEYPQITDYLDAIVKSDKQAIQDYIEACKAVKLKYPKD